MCGLVLFGRMCIHWYCRYAAGLEIFGSGGWDQVAVDTPFLVSLSLLLSIAVEPYLATPCAEDQMMPPEDSGKLVF